jgi:AcrR family transcriptional regulator
MSVGGFYERFSTKEAFLSSVFSLRLGGERARMERELELGRWRNRPTAAVMRAVDAMMRGGILLNNLALNQSEGASRVHLQLNKAL